jgi:hypothetical protein
MDALEKRKMFVPCRESSTAYTGFWWGNLRERNHLEDPGVDGRIILRRIFRKRDMGSGLD